MASPPARPGPDGRRTITALEGAAILGSVQVAILAETERILLFEVDMEEGARTNPHRHSCDTTGYVLSGRVRGVVGGVESTLGPGEVFVHPQEVEHYVEALTDCRWIEIKSPPIRPF